jgi:riboflavin kinase/FMN adenylyltransferase
MRILEGFLDLPPASGSCVATIGNFDGMHLGHQRIFARVRERAGAEGLPSAVVTFDPHPLKVLRPEAAPRMILTRQQKIEILREQGFDTLVSIPFGPEVADVEPERFVSEFLAARLGIRELYIGVDFRFGRRRRGDLELLRKQGALHGITVASVETVLHDGARIGASRIRNAIARGDVAEAWKMMGLPYEAEGLVVHGAGRGRGQGAPTANLQVANELIPASGVYITWTRLGGGAPGDAGSAPTATPPGGTGTAESSPLGAGRPGLTNLGTRPTFDGVDFAVENWLPDFSGDLYGRRLRVRFLERVRDERKFPDADALKEQIGRDLQAMRTWFGKHGTSDPPYEAP